MKSLALSIASLAVLLSACSPPSDSTSEEPAPEEDVAQAEEALQATGSHVFTKQFGDADGDQQMIQVAVDLDANVVLAGTFGGTLDFGGGPLTSADDPNVFVDGALYLAKLNKNGAHVFSKSFGGPQADFVGASSVATDALGRIYVAGSFAGTVNFGGQDLVSDPGAFATSYLAVFDRHGNHLRSRAFASGVDILGVQVDLLGHVYLGGSYEGTVDLGDGPRTCAAPCESDGLVIKLDRQGGVAWTRALGNAEGYGYATVRADPWGRVAFAGEAGQVFDFVNGSVHTNVVVGTFGAKGQELWRHTFPVPNSPVFTVVPAIDLAGSVTLGVSVGETIDLGGGPLVASSPFPGFDFDLALARYDRDGDHLWSRIIGQGSDWQVVTDVQTDLAGNIVFSGAAGGATDFGGGHVVNGGLFFGSAFVAKADPAGDVLWVRGAAQDGFDSSMVRSSAVAWTGEVVVGGYFGGTLAFPGGPTLENPGFAQDLFLAKFTF
jgi:hypothetical protein